MYMRPIPKDFRYEAIGLCSSLYLAPNNRSALPYVQNICPKYTFFSTLLNLVSFLLIYFFFKHELLKRLRSIKAVNVLINRQEIKPTVHSGTTRLKSVCLIVIDIAIRLKELSDN